MELAEPLSQQNPDVIGDRRALAALCDNLANIHRDNRDVEKALEIGQKGLQAWRQLAAAEPGVPEFQANLAMAHVRIANFLAQAGQLPEALESLGEAESIYQRGELADSQDFGLRMRFASVAAQTGNYLALLGQQREALEKFDKALELLAPVIAAAPEHPVATYTLANALSGKADAQSRLGVHAAALETWDQALAVASPQTQPFVRLGRAQARARGGDHEAALAEAEQIEPFADPPGGHAHMLGSLYSLAAAAMHAEAASPDAADKGALMDRADELARRAVELLGEARAAGLYRHQTKQLLQENPDLEFLRTRGDLEQLLPAAPERSSPDSGTSAAEQN
jgi:tetratricopeptide (TPR) repeat protein